ncbi:MAG: YesL family protein [Lachnospiraceae bacterium]|nr:YesL family protein [Lachnospiraceae bacterium]
MNKLFDLDSPFMRALSRMGDLMILNILVLLLCIPVVTAGAAFTAMHFVLLKIVRNEEGYLVKGFFKSFKQNFRQATLLWLLMLFLIALIVLDLMILNFSGMDLPRIYKILILAVALILLIIAVYVFPVLARFDNSIKNTLRNAFFMSFLNLPKSILMVVLIFLPLVIMYFSSYSFVFMVLFGYSAPAYASAYLYSGIFKRFEPEVQKPVSDYDFSITTNNGDEETK